MGLFSTRLHSAALSSSQPSVLAALGLRGSLRVASLALAMRELLSGLWPGSSLRAQLGLSSAGSAVVALSLVALVGVESSRTRVEPVSPALAGGLLTTGPPGKPLICVSLTKLFL